MIAKTIKILLSSTVRNPLSYFCNLFIKIKTALLQSSMNKGLWMVHQKIHGIHQEIEDLKNPCMPFHGIIIAFRGISFIIKGIIKY